MKDINKIIKKKQKVEPMKKSNNKDITNLKTNNSDNELCLDLFDYVCECGGHFKRYGRKTLNQYVCTSCGLYVPYEKMYKYKK